MKKHLLSDYIALLKENSLLTPEGLAAADAFDESLTRRTVELVSCDSQNVKEGTLFLVKGAHFKAQYLLDAAKRGAICYLADHAFPGVDLPWIGTGDVRLAMALLADYFYNDPWKNLNVIGITGTKGKSTTTYYLKSILDAYEKDRQKPETGVVSSIDTYDGIERFTSYLTTPEPLDLERHFANSAESGIEYVTMEVSSQALKYDRVLGVQFRAAAFLNIGYDHISPVEHPSWEDYFHSKLLIFRQCQTAVCSLDCDHKDEILAEARKYAGEVVTFSEHDASADILASNIRKENGHTVFTVRTPSFERDFRLSMPGLFNVSNALAAIAISQVFGIPDQNIYDGLKDARVPGRMEIYSDASGRIMAVVDFAHNKMSFEKLFASIRREYPGHRVVIVFGCPGGKAFDRRHDMGDVAGRCADHVYLTEDDPGEEKVMDIIPQIAEAVEAAGCPYTVIPDRSQAIHTAIMEAAENTVVLIAGKGADTTMKRGLRHVPMVSDAENARKALAEYDAVHHPA